MQAPPLAAERRSLEDQLLIGENAHTLNIKMIIPFGGTLEQGPRNTTNPTTFACPSFASVLKWHLVAHNKMKNVLQKPQVSTNVKQKEILKQIRTKDMAKPEHLAQ